MSTQVETSTPPEHTSPLARLVRFIRNRIVGGLMVALPIAITFWIIFWLYSTLRNVVIDPVARWVWGLSRQQVTNPEFPPNTPEWFKEFRQSEQSVGPDQITAILALIIVLLILYFLGMLFQSRLHRSLDWLLLQVPGVTTIYKAVRNVFVSLQQTQTSTERFKRVVLIKFPHPGIQVPAFVTSSCKDIATGKTILCIYVPTTPVPTSGYMLMVPEEDVIDLSWDLNETLQAIVSGGISVPKHVDYYPALPGPAGDVG